MLVAGQLSEREVVEGGIAIPHGVIVASFVKAGPPQPWTRSAGGRRDGREDQRQSPIRQEPRTLSSAGELSQEELSVRASLHRTAVGQLERGERVARVDTLIKLAGSLGIPPGDLLDGTYERGSAKPANLAIQVNTFLIVGFCASCIEIAASR